MKIRIERANTTKPVANYGEMSVIRAHFIKKSKLYNKVYDYLLELQQQAKWNAEKCQHES
jgi:hypothetical protein